MPNTAKGAPYPADTSIPDGPGAIQALAEHLDSRVPTALEVGSTGAIGGSGTATVTFTAGLFSSAPHVFLQPKAASTPTAVVQAYPVSVTASGFVVHLHTSAALPGSAWSQGVEWLAIEW